MYYLPEESNSHILYSKQSIRIKTGQKNQPFVNEQLVFFIDFVRRRALLMRWTVLRCIRRRPVP